MERLAFPIVRYLSLVYTIVIVWCTKPLLYPAFRLQVWNISSVPDLFCNKTFVHTLGMSLVCRIRAEARFSLENLEGGGAFSEATGAFMRHLSEVSSHFVQRRYRS